MADSKNVFIIEDSKEQVEVLKVFLTADNHNVVGVAYNGEDALDLIKQCSPDLILLDIVLTGEMNGIETANKINEQFNIPIIFISGNVNKEALNTNPYGYLLKPVKYEELSIHIDLAMYRADLEKQLKQSRAHLNQAQQLGNMGSWQWNIEEATLSWSDQVFRIFGLKPQEFTPTYSLFLERVYPDDRERLTQAVDDALAKRKPYDIEHRILTTHGLVRFVHQLGEIRFDVDGKPLVMIGSIHDVSDRKQAEEWIKNLAYYDNLTKLPNRVLLIDRLHIQLASARRSNEKFAVLFIDLDGFKEINDAYGHNAGDEVLKIIANRLVAVTREVDTIARIGGDEFVAIIKQTSDIDAIKIVASKMVKTIADPLELHQGVKVQVSASIGIAMYPDAGQTVDDLLTASDDAMYDAKHSGKNQWHAFTDS